MPAQQKPLNRKYLSREVGYERNKLSEVRSAGSVGSKTRMNDARFNPLIYKGASTSMAEELSFIELACPTE
jgi:hypothetical protein